MLTIILKEVTPLGKFNKLDFLKTLVVSFFCLSFGNQVKAADTISELKKAEEYCVNVKANKPTTTTNASGKDVTSFNMVQEILRSCINDLIDKAESQRDKDSCKAQCKKDYNKFINRARANYSIVEDRDESDREKQCDNIYSGNEDDIKECSKQDKKRLATCFKAQPKEGSFMESETMQMATPFLGMVNGADTMMGIYTAMTDAPGCRLSKEDFNSSEEKLQDQKKDIDEKIKQNIKDAEDAQKDYVKQMEEFTAKEGEIADFLSALPGQTEEAQDKLSSEKVKAKMEADSRYLAIVDQISDLRKKYNELVDAKMVALAENSDFAIHDECAEVAVGNDPKKQNSASKQTSGAVQATFAGAFAQGKALTGNVQKRYDNCVNVKRVQQKRMENSFKAEMISMKNKIQRAEGDLGKINEAKIRADEAINKEMIRVNEKADLAAKSKIAEYQRIQTQKATAQAQLKSVLARLESENKKSSQEMAILGMKLSTYQRNRPPSNKDGKSVADLMDQCGEPYRKILEGFKETCCDKGATYKGTGAKVCSIEYNDFTGEGKTATPKKNGTSSGKNADKP